MINLVRGRYCPFRGAPHVGFFWWEQTKCRPIRFPPSSTSREDATDDDLPTGQGGGQSAGSGGYVTTGWFARSSVALLARYRVLDPGLSCAPSSSSPLPFFSIGGVSPAAIFQTIFVCDGKRQFVKPHRSGPIN